MTLLTMGVYSDGPFETGDENLKDPEMVPAPPNSFLGKTQLTPVTPSISNPTPSPRWLIITKMLIVSTRLTSISSSVVSQAFPWTRVRL